MTGKTVNLNHSKRVALIWLICAVCFFTLFRMALHNSSQTFSSTSLDSPNSNTEQRSKLYDKMSRDLDEHGAAFLKHGETSQSLSLSDIFTLKDGYVAPVLKPANPPVRANVLYLSTEFSLPIAEAVKNIFNPYFDKGTLLLDQPISEFKFIYWSKCLTLSIPLLLQPSLHLVFILLECLHVCQLAIWFQNSSLYHFSMFHASHHIVPVLATKEEIEAEASSVKAVVSKLCPLKIVLDRVVLTSTGVLLGCWQVISGTDPVIIRSNLKNALPRAPEKQLYDAAILHTSFARLLGPPRASSPTEQLNTSDDVQFFHGLVNRLNSQIRGFKAVVSELWYVEEYDVLALALNGRMNSRKFKFGCSRT